MNRRTLLCGLTLGMRPAPLVAKAQQAGKVFHIGLLSPGALRSPEAMRLHQAFFQGLRDLGYIEGRNMIAERRPAEGSAEDMPTLAAELVRLNVDVIVTFGMPPILATRDATKTIPIVMLDVGDPVGDGLVASLARPGGNITGLSNSNLDVVPKRLKLLKECVPTISLVGVLANATFANRESFLRQTHSAAKTLGLKLRVIEVRSPADFEDTFDTMARSHINGMVVIPDPLTAMYGREIATLAAKHRMAGAYPFRSHAEAGGLVSYGANRLEQYRRAASFVDKILKGAKPGDLPVEQPTKFELVINLKTAKALGLTIPQSLLLRADHVIE